MSEFLWYDERIWEQIGQRVQRELPQLLAKIQKEDPAAYSFEGMPGKHRMVWQRADGWLQRIYETCQNASAGTNQATSEDFDRVVWAYCIEPFILTESQQLPFWLSPGLLELLLCAVGYPPENRRMLKVFDKDTCLRTRFHLWEAWKKKLLHLTGFTQMEQAASAMAAHAAGEYGAARVVAEIQKHVAVPKMSQPIEPKEPTPSAAVIVSGEVSENACQEPPGQEEERTPPLSRVEQSTPIGPQVRLSVSETDSLEVQPPAEPGAIPAGTPSSPPQVPKKGVRPKSIEDLGALPRKKQDLSEYIDAARLTELQLTCFSLRFERGLSIADIARLLGRDRKTIQEHIESAKKRIDVTRMKERFKKRSARSGME